MYIREYLLTFAKISQIQNPKKRVEELIELTGLTKEQNKLIGSLSKGYRQRVGLSQALLHDPEVLILDEPTSGLDPNQIQDIRDLIRNFGKEKTLIFSTHIMQEVKALCDRVIIINNGSIVADDPIDMLQEKLSDRQIVHVEFNKDLPIDLLKNIPGVQSVRTNGKARFTVYSSNQKDLREMLFNFSVQNNYIIYEMNKDKNSVEEVFSLLTKSSPKD